MNKQLVIVFMGCLGMAPPAQATSEIMLKAQAKHPERHYQCASCHSATPSRLHKFKAKELTEEGGLWVPPKRIWWKVLLGK